MVAAPAADDTHAGVALVRSALRARRGTLLLALFGSIGHTTSQMLTPLIGKQALDDFLSAHNTRHLAPFALLLIVVGIARGGFGGLRKYNASRLGAAIGTDLRSRMFDHVQRLSASFHDRLGAGQLMARTSSDALVIDTTCGNLPYLIQSLLMAVGGSVILIAIQPLLGIVVSLIVFGLSLLPLAFAQPMQRRGRAVADRSGDVTQLLEQQVRGLRIIKGHALEGVQWQTAKRAISSYTDANSRLVALRAAFAAAFTAVPSTAVVASLGLGGWLALHGRLSPGGLLAFLSYQTVLVGLVPALSQLLTTWPSAFASAARIAHVLTSVPDVQSPPHPQPLAPGPGNVSYESVTFGYVAGNPVLRDLDLKVEGGTSLALVGTNGCGKTTLARLLLRTHDVWAGRICLDGQPVQDLDVAELRRSIALVFEDPITFSGTVRDNIAMGCPTASEADIVQAAKDALAHDFVLELPDGYDTLLGEQGLLLSGGQRQRLSVARAIVRKPRVLVLDDATSALDPDSQHALGESLRAVMHERTTLLISHRLETVLLASQVAVIDDGRVVATGPTADLLDHPALTAALRPLDATAALGVS